MERAAKPLKLKAKEDADREAGFGEKGKSRGSGNPLKIKEKVLDGDFNFYPPKYRPSYSILIKLIYIIPLYSLIL